MANTRQRIQTYVMKLGTVRRREGGTMNITNSNKLFTWEMNLGSMSARPRDLDLALAPARSGALSLSWPSARDILPITDLKQGEAMKTFEKSKMKEWCRVLTRFKIKFKYYG